MNDSIMQSPNSSCTFRAACDRLRAALDHVHAHAAALPDRLDHEPLAERLELSIELGRVGAGAELHDRRHLHARRREEPLAGHLVERQPAGLGAAARVDQAAILEDLLKLPVLAELAVQGQEETSMSFLSRICMSSGRMSEVTTSKPPWRRASATYRPLSRLTSRSRPTPPRRTATVIFSCLCNRSPLWGSLMFDV